MRTLLRAMGAAVLVAACQPTDPGSVADPSNRTSDLGSPAAREQASAQHRAPMPGAEQTVVGQVQQAGTDELAVSRGQSEPVRLRIHATTRVRLDGKTVSAGQLQPGAQVRASFQPDAEGRPVALVVEAVSPAGQEGAEVPPQPPPSGTGAIPTEDLSHPRAPE